MLSDHDMQSVSPVDVGCGQLKVEVEAKTQSSETSSVEQSYITFLSTVPRTCSPTVCGTVNYKTPDRRQWQPMSCFDQSLDSYKPFEWSIDQRAILDPIEFSNIGQLELYAQIDDRIATQLDEDNDRFFAQRQIIPSPKTPPKPCQSKDGLWFNSDQSFTANWSQIKNKTPDCQYLSGNDLSVHCFKTPLNCSKSRQKKKLFGDDVYVESAYRQSPKDSAIETLDDHNHLSPIYSSEWRNTSLSRRMAQFTPKLSPIRARNENFVEMDISFDYCMDEKSVCSRTSTSSLACDISMESESQSLSEVHLDVGLKVSIDTDMDAVQDIRQNQFQQNVFQKFVTKTSTPSHS